MSTQKIKLIASIGVLSAAGAGLAFAAPHLMSGEEQQQFEDGVEEEPQNEIPKEGVLVPEVVPAGSGVEENPKVVPPSPPKKPQDVQSNKVDAPEQKQRENKGKEIAVKLTALKTKKTTLSGHVSDYISKTKGNLGQIANKSLLEKKLKECQLQIKQKISDLNKEKEDLTSKYDALKKDLETAEELQTEISGKLKELESDADKNNEDETRYTNFENKYKEIENKFGDLKNKKSDEAFGKSFKDWSNKIGNDYSRCSIKDLVNINNFLGENSDRVQD